MQTGQQQSPPPQRQPLPPPPLSPEWTDVLRNLKEPPYRSADVVALWHHIVKMLNMPEVSVAEQRNLSQQQTLNTLDRAQPMLMKALLGDVSRQREEDKKQTQIYRVKTIILTDKAIHFKTFR